MKTTVITAIVVILATTGLILSQSSQNPHGKLKWDCQDCHTAQSWTELRDTMNFNHDETGFHLPGAHALAQCIGCHKTPEFSHVGTACSDCHTDQHQGQLGKTCENCHTVRDWQGRKDLLELSHPKDLPDRISRLPIAGRAIAIQRARNMRDPDDCVGCHSEAFEATTNPSHAAGFSKECERCHHAASGTWTNASYTHKTFKLVGAHRSISCESCHSTFEGATSDR